MNMRELAISRVGVGEWVIDREADAAYLQLSLKQVAKTLQFGMVNIDLDENDQAIGVELLTLHPEKLERHDD